MLCAVRKLWLFIKFWSPPLLLMSLIFFGSRDANSVQHSSRLIGPLVHWLFPRMSEAGVGTCILVARKGAHVTEYALCAMLLWRALRHHNRRDPHPWNWRDALWTLALIIAYATTDELHQHFVPGRQCALTDVLLDTFGGALGLFSLWAAGRWSKRW